MTAVDKDIRKILKRAEAAGVTVERTKSNHFLLKLPDGSMITVAGTPRNGRRTMFNLQTRLRKGGITV
jgi:hypothetical protein